MKLSRDLGPNRWKQLVSAAVLVLIIFEIPSHYCAAAEINLEFHEQSSVSSNSSLVTEEIPNFPIPNEIELNSNSNRTHITNLTKKDNTKSFKPLLKFVKRIAKEFVLPAISSFLWPGNGSSLSQRSDNSTFALIGFVTFATFVLFTLMPLLTLPKRQRIARGYMSRFRSKNKSKPGPLFGFYKPAKLSRYKKPEISYAAVAVPIGSGKNNRGKGKGKGWRDTKSEQQEDFESDVEDLWNSREPSAGLKSVKHNFGFGDEDRVKTYTMGGGEELKTFTMSGSPGYRGAPNGGWSSEESQQPPIHLSTITGADSEYLTKEEIMYLLKTLK